MALEGQFGNGIIRPFVRDKKGDFATSRTADLVKAAVGQILGTFAASDFTQGELPWRPEFGSLLYLLRHAPNNAELDEIARAHVVDAIARWEPRVRISEVRTFRGPDQPEGFNSFTLRIRFNFIDQTSGAVIFEGLETSVTV